jgi:hypothetical protein
MSTANSISITRLSAAAHTAAKAAVAKAQLKVSAEPGLVFNHPWIIGIIFKDAEPADANKYQLVSEHVTSDLAKVALNPQPLPPRALPATYIFDHVIICGYLPVDEAAAIVQVE